MSDSPPDPDAFETTSFGFLLDADASVSAVDKGPPADSAEVRIPQFMVNVVWSGRLTLSGQSVIK